MINQLVAEIIIPLLQFKYIYIYTQKLKFRNFKDNYQYVILFLYHLQHNSNYHLLRA